MFVKRLCFVWNQRWQKWSSYFLPIAIFVSIAFIGAGL
ncbi:hypothetical protein LEP1GSC199_2072 [Leptospira vanthielii serovar Holland str. Waz Holland = ATCC 700522]|uniref:Uncharacterized protein n=1 Tax=Leptospira vanthielii serovar Holland str. Waz Holland = ATCC 700522 TaxID=1218591 RepID=N1W3J8_9LEPT|nr:hypothetical protein LEP1GSC199_2072 [Leptospira vanthielii serovar Holland str. Waz Holland = ATCC 700522]